MTEHPLSSKMLPSELDIAATAAILLFLAVLIGGFYLWILGRRKEKERIVNTVSVSPWSIGWVNFGLFTCTLIISVSFAQSLIAPLIGPSSAETDKIEEVDIDRETQTTERLQPSEETGSANPAPWALVLSILSFQIPMIIAFYGLRKIYPETFGGPLNRKSVSIREAILETIPEFIRCFPIIWLAGLLWLILLTGLKKLNILDEFPPQQLLTIISSIESPLVVGLLVIFAVVLAPFVEEIIFRGAIYRFLKAETCVLNAQIISGSLFAAVHFNLFSFLPLLVIGVLLARIYEKKGNILFPMVFHAYWNGFSLLMLLLTNWSEFSFQ